MRFGQSLDDEGSGLHRPAQIVIDHEHVELFQSQVAPGRKIAYLIAVSSQDGPSRADLYACLVPRAIGEEELAVETVPAPAESARSSAHPKYEPLACAGCHPSRVESCRTIQNGDCLACHQAHTAPHEGLLKADGVQLCLECHEK